MRHSFFRRVFSFRESGGRRMSLSMGSAADIGREVVTEAYF